MAQYLQVRDATGVDRNVQASINGGLVIRDATGVDRQCTHGQVRDATGVDRTFWLPQIIILGNSTGVSNYGGITGLKSDASDQHNSYFDSLGWVIEGNGRIQYRLANPVNFSGYHTIHFWIDEYQSYAGQSSLVGIVNDPNAWLHSGTPSSQIVAIGGANSYPISVSGLGTGYVAAQFFCHAVGVTGRMRIRSIYVD